jgi:uncharacterized membrane protein
VTKTSNDKNDELLSGETASTVTHVRHQAVSFSGPLPPPAVLAQYNEVIPNGAERIMAMAERQSAHREQLEASVVAANIASQARGMVFAFILSFVTIIGGFGLVATGKSLAGVATIIGSLATLAAVFVYARREQQKERAAKSDALKTRKPKIGEE